VSGWDERPGVTRGLPGALEVPTVAGVGLVALAEDGECANPGEADEGGRCCGRESDQSDLAASPESSATD